MVPVASVRQCNLKYFMDKADISEDKWMTKLADISDEHTTV